METVRELKYLGDKVSAVTTITRCGLVKHRECGELLNGRKFPPKLKGVVYQSYVRPAIMGESKAWCLVQGKMIILHRAERSIVRAMCGVQIKHAKRTVDLMVMLGWNETIDKLAMASSVCWYGHVLRRVGGHVLREALHFVFESQRKEGILTMK